MPANVTITGINQVLAALRAMRDDVKDATKQGVEEVCLDLQGKSQQLAPIDTGDLRASASVQVTGNNNVVGTVGFNEPYAMKQHETLWYNHPRGGQAKYLEDPLKLNETAYIHYIANKIRGRLP